MKELIGNFEYNPVNGHIIRLVSHRADQLIGERVGYRCNIHGYRYFKFKGKRYREHTVAWFLATGESTMLDHVNGIRDDNRLSNLRKTTNALNMQNKGAYRNNQCGTTGVSATRYGKWTARISLNGKTKHLGNFETIDEAKSAYLNAKEKLHEYQPTPRE